MSYSKRQEGFTLIELMIVVAVISIISTIALPLYNDYKIRAKVAEAMSLFGPVKIGVAETALAGTWPTNNNEAGLVAASSIVGSHVGSVAVSRPDVTEPSIVTIAMVDASSDLNGKTLVLEPTLNAGSVSWACSAASTVMVKHLPTVCR